MTSERLAEIRNRDSFDLNRNSVYRAQADRRELLAVVSPAVVQIAAQRVRNHARWGDRSIENKPADYVGWLPTLGEEFGEVCETLTAESSRANLRAELIDLAAVALMWIDSIDREVKP